MAASPLVFDVAPGRFQQQVLDASADKIVVVDFWAEWCGPCRSLGPVLEQVVLSYAGRVALAKVNVDQDREVAATYGVQSIPAVKVFSRGQVVTEFVGALPEAQVRRVLDAVVPSPADELVVEGDGLIARGKVEEAAVRYRRALEQSPGHSAALLRLGTMAAETGQAEEARKMLSAIEANSPDHAAAQGMLARMDFQVACVQHGGRQACEQRLRDEPDSVEARYDLACCLTAEGDYEAALREFLEVLTRDRTFRDGAAKDATLRIFALVGPRSELADTYRRKLAAVLY